MKKNQLIKELQKIKGNPEIILPSDAEGNSFNPLYEISGRSYWNKDILNLANEDDLEDLDDRKKYKKCIVLWPS